MIYKLDECIYKKEKGYTFKNQIFLNNNHLVIYCFIAQKGRNVDCLLESYEAFPKAEKDKVINDYLKCKVKALKLDDDYANAKELVKLVSYNGKKY